MAKYEVPAHIEIAALKQQQVKDVDLMATGPGTPWEDRGTHGPVGGFFKTAAMSLFKPAAMYQLLRRPNSTSDVNVFVFACGGMWSLAVLIDTVVRWARGLMPEDPTIAFVLPLVLVASAPFALYALLSVATNVFNRLAEGELKKGTPRTLAQNVFGYAAGPSILAPILFPIHWTGGVVVALWMVVVAIAGARTRMRLSLAGSVVDVVLGMAVAGAIVTGAYFGVNWLYKLITL